MGRGAQSGCGREQLHTAAQRGAGATRLAGGLNPEGHHVRHWRRAAAGERQTVSERLKGESPGCMTSARALADLDGAGAGAQGGCCGCKGRCNRRRARRQEAGGFLQTLNDDCCDAPPRGPRPSSGPVALLVLLSSALHVVQHQRTFVFADSDGEGISIRAPATFRDFGICLQRCAAVARGCIPKPHGIVVAT